MDSNLQVVLTIMETGDTNLHLFKVTTEGVMLVRIVYEFIESRVE